MNKVHISSSNYECKQCHYTTCRKSQYDRHLTTAKHKFRTNGTNRTDLVHINKFECECGKIYTARNSFWYHKQKCKGVVQEETQVPPPVDSSLVIELLKQNQEFKELMIDQHKRMTEQQDTIIELSKNVGNTTNNTNNTNNTINNTTNNKFNLNVFLNETCKDAINLNDFIQSIVLSVNDFIKTGEVGYVRGISNIMLERIRDMDPHVRPIHCTDFKRETVYVKDSDKWSKEDENKTHLRKAVKIVANKNKNQVHSWIQENPEYDVLNTPECEKFFEYSKVSLGGYGKDEGDRYDNKIISNVLKEVVLDKENI